ncbi:hypothetical protein HHK36_009315 [Tetracentron sinense]|uniref:BED-type domain-containing protein n=1 Tax=Tetracentron sinense TaxID=13715 RepID=A0A834ZF15_TETSI|nr:hypothetical protein HHK36_009315 [Tetracentron sinense]
MLEAKSLRKAVVPPSLLENPSPANLQSTRLALHVNGDGSSCCVYIASGCRIYKVKMLRDSEPDVGWKHGWCIDGNKQKAVCNYCGHRILGGGVARLKQHLVGGYSNGFGIRMEDSSVTRGKESLLIPVPAQFQAWKAMRKLHSSHLNKEEDNLVELPFSEPQLGDQHKSSLVLSDFERLTYSVLPRDSGVGEGSWAGLCFSPSQWSMAAVARSFCKSIDVYDQDIHLRSLRTLWYPSSLSYVGSSFSANGSSILAIAEGCQLSIWDLRVKENGGCVQRICGSIGDIFYAVCSSSSGAIAVGGADRTVTIYDPRRWSALSRWVHCSKYEITGLAFSSIDPDHIYIQEVDYEVFCGQWKESKKVFSFRGDSNWLGFSKCSNRDVLGGWCDSGSIFVADIEAKEH